MSEPPSLSSLGFPSSLPAAVFTPNSALALEASWTQVSSWAQLLCTAPKIKAARNRTLSRAFARLWCLRRALVKQCLWGIGLTGAAQTLPEVSPAPPPRQVTRAGGPRCVHPSQPLNVCVVSASGLPRIVHSGPVCARAPAVSVLGGLPASGGLSPSGGAADHPPQRLHHAHPARHVWPASPTLVMGFLFSLLGR